jgi:hypothetical protein
VKILGRIFIILSVILWVVLAAVPFFQVSVAWKAAIAMVFIVFAEIIFWVGCLFAGAEWAKRVGERFAEKLKKKPITSVQ